MADQPLDKETGPDEVERDDSQKRTPADQRESVEDVKKSSEADPSQATDD
jgi:hypothetical protein